MDITSRHASPARRWLKLGTRVARLFWHQPDETRALVCASYDRIAPGYDEAWTEHMRSLTLRMLDQIAMPTHATCLDLGCGTGFVAGELARRGADTVTGVDASAGMLETGRQAGGDRCRFVQADSLAFLRSRPSASVDLVTCAWALGYMRPWQVVRELARVLRPGGQLAVIDNTLFSLAGVLWCSILAFAERPAALRHAMQVRFLPHSQVLAAMLRACGLSVRATEDGTRTYYVPDGHAAIERLTATGAAAGFEFAASTQDREIVFERFAEIIEKRCAGPAGVAITHRYLMAVGEKQ